MNAEQPEDKPVEDHYWHLRTEDQHLRALVVAFESLPVTSRLHYVSNLLLDRMNRDQVGGEKPVEPELAAAYDILESVRNTIEKVPGFDQMMPG